MIIKNLNTDNPAEEEKYLKHLNLDSPLFLEIEKRLNDFIENSNPASELKDKFFSSDAIYNFKDCIIEEIEGIFNTMNEENLDQINLNDPRIDLFATVD